MSHSDASSGVREAAWEIIQNLPDNITWEALVSALSSGYGIEQERKVHRMLELDDAALLSEAALAEEWNRPEEDEAWACLLLTKTSM